MKVMEITKENFNNDVINSNIPVLVDFNANWCGPCRMLKPILDELASEIDNCKIVSVDVDSEEELAINYQISSIPCLILFENGKEKTRVIGLRSKSEIENLIKGEK